MASPGELPAWRGSAGYPESNRQRLWEPSWAGALGGAQAPLSCPSGVELGRAGPLRSRSTRNLALFYVTGKEGGGIGLRPSIFLVNLYNKRVQSISSSSAWFPVLWGRAGRRPPPPDTVGRRCQCDSSTAAPGARSPGHVYHAWLISFVQERTRKIRGRSAKRELRRWEPSPGTHGPWGLPTGALAAVSAQRLRTMGTAVMGRARGSQEPHLCAEGACCPRRHQAGHRSWRACWPTHCRGHLQCSGSLCSAIGESQLGLSRLRWQGAGGSALGTCRQKNAGQPSPGDHSQETSIPLPLYPRPQAQEVAPPSPANQTETS